MNRKVQIAAVVLSAAVGVAIAFCIAANEPKGHGSEVCREVVDMTSHLVHIPFEPQRVLSLCTSATDTIVRLGAVDRLAAIDEYSRIVPGTKNILIIGKGSAISREQVIALGIDLAIIWWYQDDASSLLEGLSIPVVRIRSGRITEVPATIQLLGKCLNRSDIAESLAGEVAEYVKKADSMSATSRRRVYLELYSPLRTVGGDTYINDLIELSGASNIAADASGSVQLSAEHLIEADPDVILFVEGFSTVSSITRRSVMRELTAAKTGRVYPINRYWLVAGAGLPDAEQNLRRVLNGNSHFVQERQ